MSRKPGAPVVYFLLDTAASKVKIGWSATFFARLPGHLTSNPSIHVLATIPGDRAAEAEIHEMWDHLRTCGDEWFAWTQELHDFIVQRLAESRASLLPLDGIRVVTIYSNARAKTAKAVKEDFENRLFQLMRRWLADRTVPVNSGNLVRAGVSPNKAYENFVEWAGEKRVDTGYVSPQIFWKRLNKLVRGERVSFRRMYPFSFRSGAAVSTPDQTESAPRVGRSTRSRS